MPSEPTAACPLPDGSLCGTCPDCQADAINDAQWPGGGAPVVIPEQPAAQDRLAAFGWTCVTLMMVALAIVLAGYGR